MDKKRPQLNPDDLGRLRWGLGAVLAVLSVITVFFMDVDAGVLMPIVALAALAAVIWPTWPARVPRLVHRLAFPVIVLAFVYDLTRAGEPLPALIRLDLLLILYRLVTYRQRRDDLQIVLLGLFLIIVAGVITVSLSFAVQLLAFTGCALVMLLAVTLEHADGQAAAPIPAGVVPSWARGSWRAHGRRWRAATDLRLVALGAAGYLAMVVVSGLLFLAIPRFEIQNSLFMDRLINRATRTGFSDHVRFGEVTEITADNGLAFSVDVTDPGALPASPYWRMVVLDEYTGDGFKMSDAYRRALNGFRPLATSFNGRGPMRYGAPEWTIYMEPGISRYLPLLGNFYAINFTEPQTFSLSDELRVMALQRDPPKMFAYRVRAMETSEALKDATFALRRRGGGARSQAFLELPADPVTRTRLRDLVTRIGVPTADGAAAFSNGLVHWLGVTHPYAMSSGVPPGAGDTLLRWVDSEAAGHCEFFAGSFVLLARSAGFPARLVTGFRGGTWNGFSGSFAVRNANAHAWCEIFDDTSGAWLRIDPTPGNAARAADAAALQAQGMAAFARDNSWQARLESLRVFWYRRIVNFDLETQAGMLSATKAFFSTRSKAVIAWADRRAALVRSWLQRPWDGARWTGLLGTTLGAAILWFGWRRWGRRWWFAVRRRAGRVRTDPVRREAGRWLQRGARRRGFNWPAELRDALLRLRFGATDSWPEPGAVFRSAKRCLRRG